MRFQEGGHGDSIKTQESFECFLLRLLLRLKEDAIDDADWAWGMMLRFATSQLDACNSCLENGLQPMTEEEPTSWLVACRKEDLAEGKFTERQSRREIYTGKFTERQSHHGVKQEARISTKAGRYRRPGIEYRRPRTKRATLQQPCQLCVPACSSNFECRGWDKETDEPEACREGLQTWNRGFVVRPGCPSSHGYHHPQYQSDCCNEWSRSSLDCLHHHDLHHECPSLSRFGCRRCCYRFQQYRIPSTSRDVQKSVVGHPPLAPSSHPCCLCLLPEQGHVTPCPRDCPCVGSITTTNTGNNHELNHVDLCGQRRSHHVATYDINLYSEHRASSRRPTENVPKLRPPFPSSASPPYLICQHCQRLLHLPVQGSKNVNMHGYVRKIKCTLCRGISYFSRRVPSSSNAALRGGHASALYAASQAQNAETQLEAVHSLNDVCESSDTPLERAECKYATEERSDGLGFVLETENMCEQGLDAGIIESNAKQTSPVYGNKTLKTRLQVEQEKIVNDDISVALSSNDAIFKCLYEQCRKGYECSSVPKLNPEFAGINSLQDWLHSLQQDCFFDCPPTPVIGNDSVCGVASPFSDRRSGEARFTHEPPLHSLFGYKSARDLLYRTFSSDDDTLRAPSDMNSSPSTSNASTNTFKPPEFTIQGESVPSSPPAQTQRDDIVSNTCNSPESSASSLVKLLKEGFKEFGKHRIIVNGHPLCEAARKRAEVQAGKMRPGKYWYDSRAGFWGVVGGPCLGVIPPFIEELHHPMAVDCSNGDSQVFVNGRELHHKDLVILSERGLPELPGRAYIISFDGTVIDQVSGQELMHLGKLAPTVEKRGQGFGMYAKKIQ
ncbi:hypothetical protein KP509_07G093700 [Ceratopteris richardii]|uniref:Uncharacterized protein n=1 Tax=Ceratopteris richardii TaxID=49495 RepID=A0A8T2UD98_CERRI|nr:hypothetical protein KP509_07G093700 [Ceratopteris richardii]KAH7433935.1 hypothetical protein KP509_07G093700 [Ceratopteris richardii]KAH7433936.1 hypothetical protein KP509_07G093700 [Ceratopteris richardii]KAH7433937.1 hypothetical protein KP509_07G093700 [Ceratopteris richardii]